MKENTFLILDGTALLHKHYYATIPKALYRKKDMKMQIQHTSYGTYTNAISSVLSSICSILTACNPTYFCICFEEEKDGPTPLLEQSKLLPQILSAIGIKVFNGNMDTQIHALTSTFEKTCKIQIFTRKFSYLHQIIQQYISCRQMNYDYKHSWENMECIILLNMHIHLHQML